MKEDFYMCLRHERRVPLGHACVKCVDEARALPASPGEVPRLDQPADSIGAMLDERGKRYGKFEDHACISQMLKNAVFYTSKERGEFAPDQVEALEMICHKIARIVNGDPNYADNWVDIAGYAKLVADRLQGVEQ